MGSAIELLQSGTTHRVKQAEVNAARVVQKAYNEREAATTSLARFAQSVGNQRKLEAAGKALNAQARNIQASLDAATTGTFVQRLRAASELGAATVAAAAAGVGGGSVEAYRQTLALNTAINEQAQQAAIESDTVNAKGAMGDTIRNAIASLDNDQFAGNFDYTIHMDHVKQKNLLGAALAVGAATYFGGPLGGLVASDLIASGNRMANRDMSGGNQLLTSAVGNLPKAYQHYREMNPGTFTPKSSYTVGGASTGSSGQSFWSQLGSAFTIK